MNTTILISSIVFATSFLFGWLYIKYQAVRANYENLLSGKKSNLLVDLDLATSEQLIKELRRRPGCPYLMISKVDNDNQHGLNIEVHNIPPQQCFSMLHSATGFLFNEMKQRGIVPPMPSSFDEDEGMSWQGD